ncbi:TonB-dependent receptor domain-containing protein [Maribacter sp. 2-571]|uniref:TonB-dependent receptor domain-containing protein n=1 Tax=Maribacter sp. 2-571 TaxID=3417569 RepID=UPI003D34755D
MRLLSICLVFLYVVKSNAQEGHAIQGTVTDKDGMPITVGDILLFKKDGDSLQQYTVLVEGTFRMDEIASGAYRLRISAMGYATITRSVVISNDLTLRLSLEEEDTALEAVTVTAAKPIAFNRGGNFTLDVTNPVLSSIPDPVALLEKLPGVQVSPDRESITILGKGTPLLYLDKQRISMDTYKTLSVDAIDSITILKNPSSKYEADGRAVVLIKGKAAKKEGVRINFKETLSQRQNGNSYHGIDLSLVGKRLQWNARLGYNLLQTWESNRFAFDIPEANTFTDYEVLIAVNDRKQTNAGTGLTYTINSTDYLSVNADMRLQNDTFPIATDTRLIQDGRERNIRTHTDNGNTKDFISVNANYNTRWNETVGLFVGGQYTTFQQKLNTEIFNATDGGTLWADENRNQSYGIDVFATRFDLEQDLGKHFKLELGANITEASANANARTQTTDPPRTTLTDFDYSERRYAAYTQVAGKIGAKITFNSGARIERNIVNAMETPSMLPSINRDNSYFFPKVLLEFRLDSTKQLLLNYAKSISRPDYSRTSVISAFINPFLEGSGNRGLLPAITQEWSATLQSKNKVVGFSYARRKAPIYFTIGYDEGLGKAVLSQRNLDREHFLEISANMPFSKGKWTATNYAAVSLRKTMDGNAWIGRATPYVYISTNHQFTIAKDTTLSFGGWGITRRGEGIFDRNGMLVMEAAITTTLLKKWRLALRFNDITRAMRFEEAYSVAGVTANGTYFADGRELALTVQYTLGKGHQKVQKNRTVDEELERIR